MTDCYGDDSHSASDQDELVGGSTSDLDDDMTDVDEMQFSIGKSILGNNNNNIDSATTTTTNSSYNSNNNNNNNNNGCHDIDNDKSNIKSKSILMCYGLGLLTTSFLLLIVFPLYYRQLELGGEHYNGYGGIIYISSITTIFFIAAAAIASWACKWNIKFYKFPFSCKRLLIISFCCGIAGILCTISSFRRVPCHLQDPLKGAALVYSLIFYFFFCRKVMGLQRIFSATTAVVGLFISVDYGLCDEFRCRGADITTEPIPTVGWQGRAVWTLLYVAGIALWTLHLSLLEAHVITMPGNTSQYYSPPANLLTTVSRIVSNSDPLLPETPVIKVPKQKPKPLHIIGWIHTIMFIIILCFGWIDIVPGSGKVKSFSDYFTDTGQTILCHMNLQYNVPDLKRHQATLDFLSNLTPNSLLYNQTVQKLRRNKRNFIINENHEPFSMKYFHKRININKLNHDDINNINNNNNKTIIHINNNNNNNSTKNNYYHITKMTELDIHGDNIDNQTILHYKKINTEKHRKKIKTHLNIKNLSNNNNNINSNNINNNNISNSNRSQHQPHFNNNNNNNNNNIITQTTSIKISHLVLKSAVTGDCNQLSLYTWLVIIVYIAFTLCLYNFLVITESAVFTITVITSALPLIGILWSVLKLTTVERHAVIMWSPEVTGELICSLLGTPIVFLGIGLLCRSYSQEMRTSSSVSFSSTTTSFSSIGTGPINRNEYSSLSSQNA